MDRLVSALAVVAGVMLCGLVLLICVDVLARSSRAFSIPWTLDIAEYSLYLITFLGAPWVLREQGHIAIEIFVEQLPLGAQRLAAQLVNVVGLAVCLVLMFFSFRQLWRSYDSGNLVYETFVYAEWYQYVVPPPVFLILGLLFLRRFRGPTAFDAQYREGL